METAMPSKPTATFRLASSGYRRLLVLICALTGGLALLYWFPPETSWFYPPCLIRTATGFYCPGCGTTRALHALLHGNLRQAVQHNLLLVALLPALAAFVGVQALSLAQSGQWRELRFIRYAPVLLLGLMLLFGLLRNLPFAWAATLAP